MKLGILFSGGKDSLFACYRAMSKEEVVCLITVISRNEESYMFHTPNIHLARIQAEAAGLPLVSVETEGEKEAELLDLRTAISRAIAEFSIEGVVTGAIQSVYQASRIQRICQELDIWCFNPLWHTDQEEYLQELVSSDFKVIISGVSSYPFDDSWLGRMVDREFIRDIKVIASRYGISLTGEGGELETFVTDAPFFIQRIEVEKATKIYKNYRGNYRIETVRLVNK